MGIAIAKKGGQGVSREAKGGADKVKRKAEWMAKGEWDG